MVDAKRLSNGKCKADNNRKCGDKYLAWAFVEAPTLRGATTSLVALVRRKAAKAGKIVATKALGCKLAKAAWYVMVQQCNYDEKRMFRNWPTSR